MKGRLSVLNIYQEWMGAKDTPIDKEPLLGSWTDYYYLDSVHGQAWAQTLHREYNLSQL